MLRSCFFCQAKAVEEVVVSVLLDLSSMVVRGGRQAPPLVSSRFRGSAGRDDHST
jgi:hypothetical protein